MKRILLPIFTLIILTTLSACFKDDENKKVDEQWKVDNAEYLETIADLKGDDGNLLYTRIVPEWSPSTFVLMRWHNDRSKTASALVPMNNSTCDIKYECSLYNGTVVDNSYSQTTYGDSIYRMKANAGIVGMQIALTNMHVGDSVTVVMPYTAAYGVYSHNNVSPYSTLVFRLKLVDVPAYEVPN